MAAFISRELLNRILDAAQVSPDREVCGLLLGQGDSVTAILPAANVAADPACRFEIDPVVLIGAHRLARGSEGCGLAVLGHYHSHPSGDVAPSACDAEMAHADGALWLICDAGRGYGLWRSTGEGLHGRFGAVPLVVGEGPEQQGGGASSSQSFLASPMS